MLVLALCLVISAFVVCPQFHVHACYCSVLRFLLWSPYGLGQTIIFSSCGFFLSSIFFSSPNVSGRTLDVYHTIRKNLLNTDTSPTCPHNMVNFGLLTAEICWRVWGTLANFNGFGVLAALLHGTLVVGVSQTLLR